MSDCTNANCRECGARFFMLSCSARVCDECLQDRAQVVACVVVLEAVEMQRSHESAAQYYSVSVEPGIYFVKYREGRNGRRYLSVDFPGIVTSSGYGSRVYEHEIGKTGSVNRQPYRYELLEPGKCFSLPRNSVVFPVDVEALQAIQAV